MYFMGRTENAPNSDIPTTRVEGLGTPCGPPKMTGKARYPVMIARAVAREARTRRR